MGLDLTKHEIKISEVNEKEVPELASRLESARYLPLLEKLENSGREGIMMEFEDKVTATKFRNSSQRYFATHSKSVVLRGKVVYLLKKADYKQRMEKINGLRTD